MESKLSRALAPKRPDAPTLTSRQLVKAWWQALRPPFFIVDLIPVGLGGALAARDLGYWPWGIFAVVMVGCFCLHTVANIANDLFDYLEGVDTDETIGGTKVIQNGWISPRQICLTIIGLLLSTVLIGWWLIGHSGQEWLWGPVVFAVLSAVFYVAPPIRYGCRGYGELFVCLNMGFIMVMGSYAVMANGFSAQSLALALPVGLMVAGILYYQSLPEIETDLAAGKRTLANILGKAKADPSSFAKLAKENSVDTGSAVEGGDLSFFGRGMMVKPFEDAVFSAKKGDIVGPVESDFGWHVIYVTDIHPARVRDFNEVRADIEAEYIDQMALREFSEKAEEFTNIVYEQADSLEPAAQKFGLKLMTAEDVTRQGPADPELAHVLENLYGSECLQEKRNSAAVEVGSNQLVAARVEKHFPKAVRPFDEVKGQIEDGLKLRKAGELAKAAGEKKVAEVRQSKSLDGFSKAVWVSRQNLLGHPAQLVDRMVALPADKLPAYTGMQVDGGAYFVAFVNAAKVKAPTENELKSLSREFTTIYGEADRRGYLSALRQELGEEILRPDFIKGENKGEDAE